MRFRVLIRLFVTTLAFGCGDDGVDLTAIADDSAGDTESDVASSEDDDDTSTSPDATTTTVTETADSSKEALANEAKQGSETVSDFFASGISASSEECMLAGLLADDVLLEAILAAGPDADLSSLAEQDQLAAIDLGLSCVTPAELSETIQASFDADLAGDAFAGAAADCVGNALTDESNPDRGQLLLGLVAVSEERIATPDQTDLLVAMMVDCIDPGFLVDAAFTSIDDPLFDSAVDRGCLDATFGDQSYLEGFWRLFIAGGDIDFDDMAPSDQAIVIGPFFDCVSFGQVIDASAAEAGVDLSAASIACIDDALDSGALVDSFLSGDEFDESQFVAAVLPCLSVDELAALGG